MSSITNVNNTSITMSRQNIDKTDLPKHNLNVTASFSHEVMPESKPLSARVVEQLPERSCSIPLSIPAFGDSRISQEEEKTFTTEKPVFVEDDLELPSVMPKMFETALPEVIPSIVELEKTSNPVFKKTEDVAQYGFGDWSGYIGKSHTKNEQEAYEIARKDERVEFFFRVKEGARLVLGQSNNLRVFYSGETAFFSGKPQWGSAAGYADGYQLQI